MGEQQQTLVRFTAGGLRWCEIRDHVVVRSAVDLAGLQPGLESNLANQFARERGDGAVAIRRDGPGRHEAFGQREQIQLRARLGDGRTSAQSGTRVPWLKSVSTP